MKHTMRVFLSFFGVMMVLFPLLCTDAYGLENLSDRRAKRGNYSSTIGEMAAKRLWVYGFLDEPFSEERLRETPDRLDAIFLLYQAFGEEMAETEVFTDVPQKYREAVSWGYQKGIVKGIGQNTFGNGPLTQQQCYVFVSRLLGWNTENAEELQARMEEKRLVSPQRTQGRFTWADLLHILCEVLDYAYPEKCEPARAKIPTPKTIQITADSFESAKRQLDWGLSVLPDAITITLSESCSTADRAEFEEWIFGADNLSFQMATLPKYPDSDSDPYTVQHLAEGKYTIHIKDYSEAYLCAASVRNDMQVFEDKNYADHLRDYYLQELLPLKYSAKSQTELITSVHDLILKKAAYDYDEYDQKTGKVLMIHPDAHRTLGFFSGKSLIVCDGYANVLSFSLVSLRIPCYMVVSGNHAWNRVVVDGEQLNIDATWDDLKRDKHYYFMKSDAWWNENHD